MELFADGLHFPTSLAPDPDGNVYIAQSGLPFGGAPKGGTVLRIDRHGVRSSIASDLREPVNGLCWHDGMLIVSEGGVPGRISRIDPLTGQRVTLLDNLPGFGNYQTNMAVVGPDGKLYFSQGAMTNSGVIGPDSKDMAWLRKIRHHCDLPGYDITLGDVVSLTLDPSEPDRRVPVRTSAFSPYGTERAAGERLRATLPCTSSVMRCNLDGSGLELVAWGIRNAYGLGFLQDGRLLATDQGADERGVRPIGNCPDFLYEIKAGAWYGWPDYFGGLPVSDPRFQVDGTAAPGFVLGSHDELPPPETALLDFEVNACAVKFAQVPDRFPAFAGDLIVAQFGDERPMTGPPGPRVGRNLVRVSVADWSLHPLPDFALRRPIDVAFCRTTDDVYVLDFGDFEFTVDKSISAAAGSGRLWRLDFDSLGGN